MNFFFKLMFVIILIYAKVCLHNIHTELHKTQWPEVLHLLSLTHFVMFNVSFIFFWPFPFSTFP